MQTMIAVAGGGAIGAVLRWVIATRLNSACLPWGTWSVNVIGSFLIGVVFILLMDHGYSEQLKSGLMVGVLGGFTTFSAFSLEVVQLLERGQMRTALLYVFASMIVCVLAAYTGMLLARSLSAVN